MNYKQLADTKSEYQHQVQAGLVLHNLIMCNFALMQPEHLHHFFNLCHNFQFNVIWHTQSVATFIFCRRLPESDVTVTPSVTCMN